MLKLRKLIIKRLLRNILIRVVIQNFKEVTAAYEVLTDADKRDLYDKYGEEGIK